MRPDPELRPDSLMQKIRSARQSDASFRRAHRTVQIIMASWAVIVVLDRLIGLVSHSYTGSSLPLRWPAGPSWWSSPFWEPVDTSRVP